MDPIGFIVNVMKVVLTTQDKPHYLAAMHELHSTATDNLFKDITVTTTNVKLGGHFKPYKYDR
jgi:hypothetical protein